jgi:hypothetical protein
VFEPGELTESERAPTVDHVLGGRRPPQPLELGKPRPQRIPPLVEELLYLVLGQLRPGGERELERLRGRRKLAPRTAEELLEVAPPAARDLVQRPLPLALPLDRNLLDVALLDERPQRRVDRRVLDREEEPEAVVLEDLLDPVAVQRRLREEPEDEQSCEDAPILKL